ncbi:MAG: type II toxin-antitoxin system RelE/ParE family toxin [Nitrospirota bacterium]
MSNGSFGIVFEQHARRDLESFPQDVRLSILEEIQKYLSHAPFQSVKTRIKRMNGFTPPLYRLRIGDYRVYYRIYQRQVVILTALHKKDSEKWLSRL